MVHIAPEDVRVYGGGAPHRGLGSPGPARDPAGRGERPAGSPRGSAGAGRSDPAAAIGPGARRAIGSVRRPGRPPVYLGGPRTAHRGLSPGYDDGGRRGGTGLTRSGGGKVGGGHPRRKRLDRQWQANSYTTVFATRHGGAAIAAVWGNQGWWGGVPSDERTLASRLERGGPGGDRVVALLGGTQERVAGGLRHRGDLAPTRLAGAGCGWGKRGRSAPGGVNGATRDPRHR